MAYELSGTLVEKKDVLFIEGIGFYFNGGIPVKLIEFINKEWGLMESGDYSITLTKPEFVELIQKDSTTIHWFTNMLLFNFKSAQSHYCTSPMSQQVIKKINETGLLIVLTEDGEGFGIQNASIKGHYYPRLLNGKGLSEAYNSILFLQLNKFFSDPEKVTLTNFP